MASNNEQPVIDAWRGMLFSHAKVLRALEADMIAKHDIPITWFDIMSRLIGAPNKRLRMHELEEALLFTRSGITALADRLEKAGLVRRERSPEDRRGVYLAITQAGVEKFEGVWADHKTSIFEHFGQYIDLDDAAQIKAITSKILASSD